jgi:soluble lytic murein transglycosylase-like protein
MKGRVGPNNDDKARVALPARNAVAALIMIAASTALAGCTMSEIADERSLSLNANPGPDDPMLPETVAYLPEASPHAFAAAAPGEAGPAVQVAEAQPVEQPVAGQPAPQQPIETAAARPAAQVGEGFELASVSSYAGPTPDITPTGAKVAARSPELDQLIARYASVHQIPESLLRRVVNRESTFNPAARNGPYWGLMQIRHDTAQTMGYRGPASGLLDAETNLIYAGKYLRGAFITAGGNHDQAVRFYSRGYYYDAKRKGLLEETGLKRSRKRMPDAEVAAAVPASAPVPTFAFD